MQKALSAQFEFLYKGSRLVSQKVIPPGYYCFCETSLLHPIEILATI